METRDALKIPNLEWFRSLLTPIATEFGDSRDTAACGLDELGEHQVLFCPRDSIAERTASARWHWCLDLRLGEVEVLGH